MSHEKDHTETLLVEELKKIFHNADTEQFNELARKIQHHVNTSKLSIDFETKKINKPYCMQLKKARAYVVEAVEAVEELDETLFVHKPILENFITNGKMIINCIPEKKPAYINKKTLEHLFLLLHIECEKIISDIGWSNNGLDNKPRGRFFRVCVFVVNSMGLSIPAATIHNYINKAKDDRKKMGG